MQTEVKICGLSTEETVRCAVENGANMIGFIFFEKSPRNVTAKRAAELSAPYDGCIKSVAVTVNAEDAFLDEIVTTMKPAMLQLHGSETPERVNDVKQKYDLPVIKAFSVSSHADFEKTKPYENIADRFLFDAKPPKDALLPGGNGVAFDWALFASWQQQAGFQTNVTSTVANNLLDSPLPPMLSGGINEANVIEALTIGSAKSIDLSSGVESAPGIKDCGKIRTLMKKVSTAI